MEKWFGRVPPKLTPACAVSAPEVAVTVSAPPLVPVQQYCAWPLEPVEANPLLGLAPSTAKLTPMPPTRYRSGPSPSRSRTPGRRRGQLRLRRQGQRRGVGHCTRPVATRHAVGVSDTEAVHAEAEGLRSRQRVGAAGHRELRPENPDVPIGEKSEVGIGDPLRVTDPSSFVGASTLK